jgi:translation elongation factor EF-Tu-like GTPase
MVNAKILIYQNKPLIVRILFESFRKKPVFGVFRPQVYMEETGTYSSNLKFDIFKKEILPHQKIVREVLLESPAGFGEYLREGALFTVKEGLDIVGKAILLEVIGYF